LQPQRVEYWLNAKPDDPVAFTAQVLKSGHIL